MNRHKVPEAAAPAELLPLTPKSVEELQLDELDWKPKQEQVKRKRPCRPCCFGAEEYLRCDIIFLLWYV